MPLLSDAEFFGSDRPFLSDDEFFNYPAEDDTYLSGAKKVAENFPERMTQAAGGLMQEAGSTLLAPGEKEAIEIAKKGEDEGFFDNLNLGLGMLRDMPSYIAGQAIPEDSKLGRVKRWLSDKGSELFKGSAEEIKKNQPVGLSGPAQYGVDVTRGIMDMGPAIAAGAVTKSPGVTLGMMGGQVRGTKFGEDIEAGRTPGQATRAAEFHQLAEIIPESIPVTAILKRGSPFAKRLFDSTLGEGAQEVITSVLQDTYDAQDLEGMSLKDAMASVDWKNALYSGLVGMGVGGGLAAATHPFVKDEGVAPPPGPAEAIPDGGKPPDISGIASATNIDDAIASTFEAVSLPALPPADAGLTDLPGPGYEAKSFIEPVGAFAETIERPVNTAMAEALNKAGLKPQEAPKPQRWADTRLEDENTRNALSRLVMADFEPGGGVSVVPDESTAFQGPEGRVIPGKKRTPSVNPPWVQSLLSAQDTSGKEVRKVADKAVSGKTLLGKKQRRILDALLNRVEGIAESQKTDETPLFEQSPADPFDPEYLKQADEGSAYDLFYDEELAGDSAEIAVKAAEVSKTVDPDQVEALLERLAIQEADTKDVIKALEDLNETQRRQEQESGIGGTGISQESPALELKTQTEEDLVAKETREQDVTLAAKEQADKEVGLFDLQPQVAETPPVQDELPVEPVKAPEKKPESKFQSGLDSSKNFDQFKSWASGRFGRDEARKMEKSGELAKAWETKPQEKKDALQDKETQTAETREEVTAEQPPAQPEEPFVATHELADGTLVVATEEENVWRDAEGTEYEEEGVREKKPKTLKKKPATAKEPKKQPAEPKPATEEPIRSYDGLDVTYEVETQDTGETFTVTVDAGVAISKIDQRLDALRTLRGCL